MKKLVLIAGLVSIFSAGTAFSADPATPTPAAPSKANEGWNPTPEQRENMAKAHEAIAKCLRSTKTIRECHEEMRKSCQSMGQGGCPMMMDHEHGHMHGHKKGG